MKTTSVAPSPDFIPGLDDEILTIGEVCRLTFFKWRYALESIGFTREQAEYLLFMRHLVQKGSVHDR